MSKAEPYEWKQWRSAIGFLKKKSVIKRLCKAEACLRRCTDNLQHLGQKEGNKWEKKNNIDYRWISLFIPRE